MTDLFTAKIYVHKKSYVPHVYIYIYTHITCAYSVYITVSVPFSVFPVLSSLLPVCATSSSGICPFHYSLFAILLCTSRSSLYHRRSSNSR
jgi:hypothetical protein